MNCPKCNSSQIKCIDSRPGDSVVKRRKMCFDCDHRWKTIEVTVDRHSELLDKETTLEYLINYTEKIKQTLKGKRNED